MLLTELEKGEEAEITVLHADQTLKMRLQAFGVIKGELLTLKGCSLGKKTMEIEINHARIALRAEEAEKIEVEKLDN